MRMKRRNLGFTMAEMLIVMAIIAVLGGVTFVAVSQYQRSMAQVERDAIAKEIFVAAQNHLTVAESQGYLGITGDTAFGTADSTEAYAGRGVYYFIYNTNAFSDETPTALDLMLPFGSIDETVRLGGRYAIRYQRSPARVLDVFYCTAGGTKFGANLTNAVLEEGGSDKKDHRKKCDHFGGAVIGWYGGSGAEEPIVKLDAPTMVVNNAERLTVTVTVPSGQAEGTSFKLLLHGETSGANRSFDLPGTDTTRVKGTGSEYTIILDDITTSGLHFAELSPDSAGVGTLATEFIPGENITVQAITYNNSVLSELPFTPPQTTNSLFADGTQVDLDARSITGKIDNFRHLENLGKNVSDVGSNPNEASKSIISISAEQTQDLDWTGFKQAIDSTWKPGSSETVSVFNNSETAASTTAGSYVPIEGDLALTYDGVGHGIANVLVNTDGAAGLFGAPMAALTVSNLELLDFSVTSTGGNAGALAGTLPAESVVSNVIAYNSGADMGATVSSDGGSVGGLIGSMADGSVQKCAAALVVSSSGGDAGGLIGTATTGTVTACYAGGHTDKGEYYQHETDGSRKKDDDDKDIGIYNVTASTKAGGLIGDAGSASVTNSYSTCSVSGATAGGFVGTGTGTVTNCYATGLVQGTGDSPVVGAFAGTLTGNASNCHYYEIINMNAETGEPMKAVSTDTETDKKTGISALDESAASYNTFVGSEWKAANPYDTTLIDNYGNKYCLPAVEQLGGSVAATDFVATHHGDWPAPEVFVINE